MKLSGFRKKPKAEDTLENPIKLGAEGASIKRNSQAKGQREILPNIDFSFDFCIPFAFCERFF